MASKNTSEVSVRYTRQYNDGVLVSNQPINVTIKSRTSNGGNTQVGAPRITANNYAADFLELQPGTSSYLRTFKSSNPLDRPSSTRTESDGVGPTSVAIKGDPAHTATRLATSRSLSELNNLSVNLAQAYGERLQVVKLLQTTALRISTAFLALKKGNLPKAMESLGLSAEISDLNRVRSRAHVRASQSSRETAASLWLELQYGWKPLLQDIHDSAKYLAEKHAKPREFIYKINKRGKARSPNVFSDTQYTATSTSTTYGEANVDCSAVTGFTYAVTNPLLREASMLGLTNPALLAWELLPFSFVVDWFLPVGNYLEMIPLASGVKFISGYTNLKTTTSSFGNSTSYSKSGSMAYGLTEITTNVKYGRLKTVKFSRNVSFGFPSAPLPEFKNPVSVDHALNAIALLTVVFKR